MSSFIIHYNNSNNSIINYIKDTYIVNDNSFKYPIFMINPDLIICYIDKYQAYNLARILDFNLIFLDDDKPHIQYSLPELKGPITPYHIKHDITRFITPTNNLSGLCGLSVHYSSEYNKLIILMGENHSVKRLCSPIGLTSNILLYNMLRSTNKLQDVFIESPFYPLNDFVERYKIFSSNQNSYMLKAISEINNFNCIQKGDRYINCNEFGLDHVRFHHTDIRKITNIVPIIGYLKGFRKLIQRPNIINTKDIVKFLSKYKNYNEKLIRNETAVFIKNSKILKQIENIQVDDIKNKLLTLVDDIINDPGIKNVTYMKLMDWINLTSSSNIESTRDAIFEYLINYTSLLVDLYLLSRLFRTFNYKDGFLNGDSKNNIVYIGYNHIIKYRKFLNELGFQTLYLSDNVDNGNLCLDITGLKITWL